MSENSNLPALTRQVSELVLAGSLHHAEQAFSDAVEQHGDLAVVEVLGTLAPQVTALHLSGFDGGKTSLATLLVPPKAWADSLARSRSSSTTWARAAPLTPSTARVSTTAAAIRCTNTLSPLDLAPAVAHLH